MPGQTIPRAWGAQVADASAVNTAAIQPDHLGVKIFNNTGSDFPAGTLVYRSGWDATNSVPRVSLADNHVAGSHAHYVVGATAIKTGTVGTVYKHWLSTANLNTNAGNVGDPVYLDSSLGGGSGTWTLTANSGPNNRLEIVGHITVKDAAVGQIDFDVQTHKPSKMGAVELQPLTVGTATLALGGVTPDTQGLTVWNATGLTITVGQLLYVSGWNVANNMPQVSLAANNVANAAATLVCAIACANGASTLARKHYLSTATLNVTGSVGDPVYLDSTAGGWTQTAPVAPTTRQQIIGRVVAVSASVGQIDFDVVTSGGTVISRADIQPGDVNPDDSGITAWNATGITITAGQLVCVTGWNVANSLPQIGLAINNAANSNATYVVPVAISNGASGQARRHWLATANLNVTGSVGDPVYLDSVAGGWTQTAPSSASKNQQIVGRVVVVSASVGQIDFDIESNPGTMLGNACIQAQCIGTSLIANAAVTGTQMTATAATEYCHVDLGTIPTTTSVEKCFTAPCAGTLRAMTMTGKDALATSDTNFITWTVTNKGQAGAGATEMSDTTSNHNSTRATGGTALVAYGKSAIAVSLTGGNLVVAKGDTIAFKGTITGTLANTVTEAACDFDFTFTT